MARLDCIALTLLATQELVSAAVRDVGELGDIDVGQRARMVVLIPAYGLAGDAVDVGQPVDPTPSQHRAHGGGRHTQLLRHRTSTIRRITCWLVLLGLWRGRE